MQNITSIKSEKFIKNSRIRQNSCIYQKQFVSQEVTYLSKFKKSRIYQNYEKKTLIMQNISSIKSEKFIKNSHIRQNSQFSSFSTTILYTGLMETTFGATRRISRVHTYVYYTICSPHNNNTATQHQQYYPAKQYTQLMIYYKDETK